MVEDLRPVFHDPRLGCYDRIANPDRLSVWQLSPDGVEWSHSGRVRRRMYKEKGDVVLLPDRCRLVVIEWRRSGKDGATYAIDADDVVLHAIELPPALGKRGSCIPFAVHDTGTAIQVLYGDYRAGRDYWVDYDRCTLRIVDWHESR